jgi:polyhydroxybutyrate depolymerase
VLAVLPPPAAAAPVEREIAVDGTTRSYLLHVPAAWDRATPLPVLFVFHGAGSDAESMVRATGFDALAEASPMLVVYPRAPRPVRRYEVDPPAGRTSADVLLVDALLARLRERFPVDPRRISPPVRRCATAWRPSGRT